MTDEIGPPLTADEGRTLIDLLARHCTHTMDQWDTWHLALPSGDTYVLVMRGVPPGWPEQDF